MLSISNALRVAAIHYYVNYYTRKGQGVYFGTGAEKLGLGTKVTEENLTALFLGYSPNGTPLVQNAGEADRQAAWDLTFSAPKSLSVLWSQLEGHERLLLEDCHQFAVKTALAHIEARAAFTRRGKGGKTFEKAGLVFALFEDYTSRALEPQIHTHSLLMNIGVREDGTTGSIWSKSIFDLKMEAGALYRITLAEQLLQRAGLKIEPDEIGFRLAEVPQSVCDRFSTRRHQVEKEMERMGNNSVLAAKLATENTRPSDRRVELDTLFSEWRKIGAELGFGPAQARAILHRSEAMRLNKTANSTSSAHTKEESQDAKEMHEERGKPKAQPTKTTQDQRQKDSDEAERRTYRWMRFGQRIGSAAWSFSSQFVQIRESYIYLYLRPSFEKGWFVPPKPLLNVRHFGIGPKPIHWGKISSTIFAGKYGEIVIQKKRILPQAPPWSSLAKWEEKRIRFYRYTWTERLNAKLRRKFAARDKMAERIAKRVMERQQREEERKAKEEAEQKRSEEERIRREQERQREQEQNRSRSR